MSRAQRLAKREKKMGKASATTVGSGQNQAPNIDESIAAMPESRAMMATHHHDEQMRLHSKEIAVRGLSLQVNACDECFQTRKCF
jgi:hypothetical protein